MLVLSRKEGECIKIGDDITIMVVRVGPHNARIGIEAPRGLNIIRPDAQVKEPKPQTDEALRPAGFPVKS